MVFPYPQEALSLNKDKKIYANEKTKEQKQKNQKKQKHLQNIETSS